MTFPGALRQTERRLTHGEATILPLLFERLRDEAARTRAVHIEETAVRTLTDVGVSLLPSRPDQELPGQGRTKASAATGAVSSRAVRTTIVVHGRGSAEHGDRTAG